MRKPELIENRAEESRLIGTGGHLHLEHRNVGGTPFRVRLPAIGGCARRNFSTIMVLPLFVGPTRSRFGMRVRLGKFSKSSIAASADSARL